MRRAVAIAVAGWLVAMVGSVALANGLMGGSAPARIPIPAAEFHATVEDVSGVVVQVDRVTFDGEVFLFGTVGEGQVTVPFEGISEVRVEPSGAAGSIVLFAVLRDGGTARVTAPADTPCYGATSYGNYRIEVGKVRKIAFGAAP